MDRMTSDIQEGSGLRATFDRSARRAKDDVLRLGAMVEERSWSAPAGP